MLDRQKRPTISRSASTPARERARSRDRATFHRQAVEDRAARIAAERDLAERERWARQAIRG